MWRSIVGRTRRVVGCQAFSRFVALNNGTSGCLAKTNNLERGFGLSFSSFPRSFSNEHASKSEAEKASDPPRPEGDGGNQKWMILLGAGAVIVGAAVYLMKKDKGPSTTKGKSGVAKKPKPAPTELPKEVTYLIIGAGTAAFSAYRAIRAGDATAKVLLVGEEDQPPYMRPPLSKEFWYSDDKSAVQNLNFKQWNGKERSIFYEKEGFYCLPKELPGKEFGGVAVGMNHKVIRLDVKEQKAYFENGSVVKYDKCLVATGGKPKNLPVIENSSKEVVERTTLFRTIEDFRDLDNVTRNVSSVAIVGGGFLGSELACGLGKRGSATKMKVFQIFPEKGNMGAVLPEYLCKWATEKVKKEGVEVITENVVKDCKFDTKSKQVSLTLTNGRTLSVDHVIVAVGLQPNVDLASSSGLEIDKQLGGFLVNAELEARTNVWVAGDAACFYDEKLGRRRVEHHDHAVVSGRLAGENMVGAKKPYWHQSMFWSDLGPEVGYEAIGIVDSTLPTVAVFAKATEKDTPRAVVEQTGESVRSETEKNAKPSSSPPAVSYSLPSKSSLEQEDFGKGVIFYLRDDIVVGMVMWNVFNKMPIARQIIKDATKYDDLSEVAKLFNIHDEPDEEPETEKPSEEPAKKKPEEEKK